MSVTNVTPRNILAPTDFSDISNAATAYAAHLAMALNASLHVQHVIPVDTHGSALDTAQVPRLLELAERNAREKLNQLLTEGERERLQIHMVIDSGAPYDMIVEYAKQHDIDLIVMGTQGRGAVEKMWLGSVTDKVLRKAHCPVLAMRASQVAA